MQSTGEIILQQQSNIYTLHDVCKYTGTHNVCVHLNVCDFKT